MRSIRLALIVYFVLLLAAALGAVSWFVYQTTSQTLYAKEASDRKHLEKEYAEDRKHARADFDRRLLRRAQDLEKRTLFKVKVYDPYLALFGAMMAVPQPGNYLAMPLWLAEGVMPDPNVHDMAEFQRYLALYRPSEISTDVDEHDGTKDGVTLDKETPLPSTEGQSQEFVQTYSPQGEPWQRSRSLGEHQFSVPPALLERAEMFRTRAPWLAPKEPEARQAEQAQRRYFDDVDLRSGLKIRRITLIAFVPPWGTRFVFLPPPPRMPRGKDQKLISPKRDKGPGRWRGNRGVFIIQYATETTDLDKNLQALETKLNEHLARQATETRQTLAALRTRLLGIFAATLVGVVAGGYWLVRLGLSPLQRLSNAVSRVSEKDFRLHVDGKLPTELRPIAVGLTATLDQLMRAFAREKQAAADISHELRTPLAALLTTLEVALRKPRPPEEYQEILEDCRASGKQMAQLVERLLALARLDAGVDQLRVREVDVANLASQCADLVRPLADARGLVMTLHAAGPANVQADPDKLREVLTNLLHNAIEYNKPNGTIDVDVARRNGHLSLEVRDTGIGIPSEARTHIFERFFRADPSRHADTLHAGIGLAIVKGYVDLMGGTIGVESSPAGSTFRLDFPAR